MTSKEILAEMRCTTSYGRARKIIVEKDIEILEILKKYIKGGVVSNEKEDSILQIDLEELTADEFYKVKEWLNDK